MLNYIHRHLITCLKRAKRLDSIRNSISAQLLSLHVPKTAGTSFLEILRRVYQGHVITMNRGQIRRGQRDIEELFSTEYDVVHGHMHFNDLKEFISPETKIITWLRDPVERVLSNYFYSLYNEVPKRESRNVISKFSDLRIFIRKPPRRNLMTKYLDGLDLESIFFVGFQNDFQKDLQLLAQKLNWDLTDIDTDIFLNSNTHSKYQNLELDEELIYKIKEYNSEDIELYNKALQLKNQGHWA